MDANKGTSATSNVPMPIPRAKCGKTSDKIELACGICVKIQIETYSFEFTIPVARRFDIYVYLLRTKRQENPTTVNATTAICIPPTR